MVPWIKDFLIAVIVKVKPFVCEENYKSLSRIRADHKSANDSSLRQWHAQVRSEVAQLVTLEGKCAKAWEQNPRVEFNGVNLLKYCTYVYILGICIVCYFIPLLHFMSEANILSTLLQLSDSFSSVCFSYDTFSCPSCSVRLIYLQIITSIKAK